jgi:hypothetical protein
MSLEIVGADEIIGYDEIVGDDMLEDWFEEGDVGADYDDLEAMLGAAPRRRGRLMGNAARRGAALKRARLMAAASKAAGGSAMVRSESPTESRQLVIGLQSLAVPAGATVTVVTRPQILFRPTRLVVPSAVAPAFTIDDIKVGNKSQFVAAGPVPAEAFSQTAFSTPLKIDTAQISMDLIVQATNISAAPADFRASFFGDAVY